MANKKQPAGAPKWMATFADMATLLLTFFIIMLSMANVDIQSFRDLLGSIRDAFGVTVEQHGQFQAVKPDEIDPSNLKPGLGEWEPRPDQLHEETEEPPLDEAEKKRIEEEKKQARELQERQKAVKDIQQAVKQIGQGKMAEVTMGRQGIRIRVKGKMLFDPGAAEIKDAARPFLDSLVMVLQKFDYHLLVEGHTDSSPIATARFPSNWELSGVRAAAVLRYLITWGIDPARMTCIGLADNYPIAGNKTAEGRARNRRVEFVLTKKPFRPEIN